MTKLSDGPACGRWLFLALATHVLLWTLVPGLINHNLPLDTVEALAWGNQWQWGYAKHPPLSAWMTEGMDVLSGHRPWAQYLLSSLSITSAFALVYLTVRSIAGARQALLGVLVLEGMFYFNFKSPEFNVNICIMPALAGMAYALWRGLQSSSRHAWIGWVISGLCAGLAVLGKYTAVLLLLPVAAMVLLDPRFRQHFRRPGPYLGLLASLLVVAPHGLWMLETAGQTLDYAAKRASADDVRWFHRLLRPLSFLLTAGLLSLPMVVLAALLGRRPADAQEPKAAGDSQFLSPSFSQPRLSLRSEGGVYLAVLAAGGLGGFALLSLLTGWDVRTMWAAPMFLFVGPALVVFRQSFWNRAIRRRFVTLWCCVLLAMPTVYVARIIARPLTGKATRVQFPGPQLAETVHRAWEERYGGTIPIAAAEIWLASNLAYYAPGRPAAYLEVQHQAAAWVDDARLNREGGVLLVEVPDEVDDDQPMPEWSQWQQRFPRLERMPTLRLDPVIWLGEVRPFRIQWALVPPAAEH